MVMLTGFLPTLDIFSFPAGQRGDLRRNMQMRNPSLDKTLGPQMTNRICRNGQLLLNAIQQKNIIESQRPDAPRMSRLL